MTPLLSHGCLQAPQPASEDVCSDGGTGLMAPHHRQLLRRYPTQGGGTGVAGDDERLEALSQDVAAKQDGQTMLKNFHVAVGVLNKRTPWSINAEVISVESKVRFISLMQAIRVIFMIVLNCLQLFFKSTAQKMHNFFFLKKKKKKEK